MAHILVVDDERALRESYSLILASAKHTVQTAIHGEDALKVLGNFTPDIILLDIDMPKLNGIGFLNKANLSKKLPKCRVVVFTNLEEASQLDEAYKLGAHRYVLKSSLSPKQLLDFVAQIAH